MEFKFTEEQVQRMVIILGNAPYKDVADIIDSIKAQFNNSVSDENLVEK